MASDDPAAAARSPALSNSVRVIATAAMPLTPNPTQSRWTHIRSNLGIPGVKVRAGWYYSEYLAAQAPKDEDPEDALIEAHTMVAALGLVPDIKGDLEAAAEKFSNQWLTQHRVAIKGLSDERQEVYRQIREMSADPMDVDLARPNIWLQPTTAREADGTEVALPSYEKHLLCGSDGLFPENLNSWEEKVVQAELQRAGTVAWYRNPGRASQDSLGVNYEEGGELKIVRPDFIFFVRRSDGGIAVDIVDPHGIQFGDALPRLKGLAQYAEKHPGVYRRIEVVAQVGGTFRAVDLTEASVRTAVLAAETAKALYESDVIADYSLKELSFLVRHVCNVLWWPGCNTMSKRASEPCCGSATGIGADQHHTA